MTRDYSQFFNGPTPAAPSNSNPLTRLGWQPFFAQQVDVDRLAATPPVRAIAIHRNGVQVMGDGIDTLIPPGPDATVGDWLLYDSERPHQSTVLRRKSLFQRRAPGHDRAWQKIAANVDTAFIVTSCNQDFNVARLERYLALAFDAQVEPVIVLTKTDRADDPADYVARASAISARVPVVALNALEDRVAETLADWCKPGRTIAFLGSSGVGKSTLTNALIGAEQIATAAIREDDAKGRHTTSHRQLHLLDSGLAVLDTPGMRELQLADAEAGIADLFDDVTELATHCRFRDCQHLTEPGCAVLQAVEDGRLDPARLARWRKLAAEDRYNSASLAERRARDKSFGKMVKEVTKRKPR